MLFNRPEGQKEVKMCSENGERNSTSRILRDSDISLLTEVRSYLGKRRERIARAMGVFTGDAGGSLSGWIFNSSNKDEVIKVMEKHKHFYEAALSLIVMVEEGDKESYRSLLALDEELSIMEREAIREVNNNKSQALCRMLREFLGEKNELDHNLMRVDYVVQRQEVYRVKEIFFGYTMDQKETEGKTLAITDGKDEESRGNSSYVMLPSDRKAVAETRSSAGKSENQIAEAKRYFSDLGSLGLWWDAKGFFNTSNREDVIKHMEKHRKFYEAVVTFTVMVEKGDKGSYKSLLDLYEDLSIMEDEAMRDAKSNKSKAMCQMLRKFLDEKYKLDHNLKRVECVVQRQMIHDLEKSCKRSIESFDKLAGNVKELLEENRETKVLLKESNDRAEKLQTENETCKSMVESMQKQVEELCLANRRSEENSKRSEDRMRKMAEQNQRELQKISKMLASMKGGKGSDPDDGPPNFP